MPSNVSSSSSSPSESARPSGSPSAGLQPPSVHRRASWRKTPTGRLNVVSGEVLAVGEVVERSPPPTDGSHRFIHRNKAGAPAGGGSESIDFEALEQAELLRAARASKLSELESHRLRSMAEARLFTLVQLRQLCGRLLELGHDAGEAQHLKRAIAGLHSCSAHLVFEVNEAHDFARLKSGQFCRYDRLCSCCARLRAARFVRGYGNRISRLLNLGRGMVKPVHVVMTVRNTEHLGERFSMLSGSWSRLMQQARDVRKGHRKARTVVGDALAGVGSVEIKRGSGGHGWHPHMHAVLLVSAEADVGDLTERLREDWRAATRGDSCHAKVMDVRGVEAGALPDSMQLAGLCREVFKYATKSREMTPEQSYQAWSSLRGRRLIQTFGKVRAMVEPVDLGDVDPVTFDLVERVYAESPEGYVRW
jgi:hypothetical protein